MNSEIRAAVELLKSASEQPAVGREAHKKIQWISRQMSDKCAMPNAETLVELEGLIRMASKPSEIAGKYQNKIKRSLDIITNRKTLWVTESHLHPQGRKLFFAHEEPDKIMPLILPAYTFERIKLHSPVLQKQDAPSITLDKIIRKQFQMVVDCLSGNSVKDLPVAQLNDFYKAVQFLGIAGLQVEAYLAIKDSLSSQSYTDLLQMLCQTVTDPKSDQSLAEPIFYAFLEQECWYVHNQEYLTQPDPFAYIELVFCVEGSLSLEQFRMLAAQAVPKFALYLDVLEGKAGDSKQPELSRTAATVRDLRSGITIAKSYYSDFRGAVLPLSNIYLEKTIHNITSTKVDDYDQQYQFVLNPEKASFEQVQHNPKSWVSRTKLLLTKAKKAETFTHFLEQANVILKRYEADGTAKLEKFCHYVKFVCLIGLGRPEEAKAELHHFTKADIEGFDASNTASYFHLLLEMGLFKRVEREADNPNDYLACIYSRDFSSAYNADPGTLLHDLAEIAQADFTAEGQVDFTWFGNKITIMRNCPVECLLEYCQANPKHVLPRIILAQYCYRKSQLDMAIRFCTEVLSLQSNLAILKLRVALYGLQKAYPLANKDHLELLKHDFNLKSLLEYVFLLHNWQGPQAVEEYVRRLPGDEERKLCQVHIALLQNNLAEAEKIQLDLQTQGQNTLPEFFAFLASAPNVKNFPSIWESDRAQLAYFKDIYERMRKHPDIRLESIQGLASTIESFSQLLDGKPVSESAQAGYQAFSALNEHPKFAQEQLAQLRPLLDADTQIIADTMLAHRCGNYDAVIGRTAGTFATCLVADAYRQKGDLAEARRVINGCRLDTVGVKIVEAVITLDELRCNFASPQANACLETLKKAIKDGCVYQPLIYLARLYLVKVKDDYIWDLEPNTTDAIVYLFQQGADFNYERLMEFKEQGYWSPAMNECVHARLHSASKWGLMDEAFLASSQNKARYREYLCFFGRYAEVDPAGQGFTGYRDAYYAYEQGNYREAIRIADVVFDESAIQGQGLMKVFLVAKSHFALNDPKKAKAAIQRVLKHKTAEQMERYKPAFFEEVEGWAQLHLQAPRKRAKKT